MKESIIKLFGIFTLPFLSFLILKKITSVRILKILKPLLIIILFVYFFLVLILPALWCYNPSLLLNVKYEIISDLKIQNIEEPSLFISDHHIQTYDQIIMLTEILKNKNKFNIVSMSQGFHIQNFFKNLPIFAKYNLLKVYKNKKSNTVKKSIDKIKNKENVLYFMAEKSFNNNGLYHVLKETKVPIVLVKFKEIKTNNKYFGRKFTIQYQKINDYTLTEDKSKFMNFVKDKLYENDNL